MRLRAHTMGMLALRLPRSPALRAQLREAMVLHFFARVREEMREGMQDEISSDEQGFYPRRR